MHQLQKTLNEFGLNEHEGAIYLAMLGHGHTTVLKLAEQTDIKRSTAYLILQSLISKNLVRRVVVGKKRHYLPEDPEKMIQLLDSRRESVRESLPALKQLYVTKGDRPHIQFYEGKDNVRRLYRDIIKSKTEILSFGPVKEIYEEFKNECEDIDTFKKFSSKFLGSREIVNNIKFDKEYARETARGRRSEKIKIRILPTNLYFQNADNLIYDNKIVILSVKNDFFAIVIESPILANIYRTMFELAWRSSIKLN